MDGRVRLTPEQLFALLEYMETHGDLARPLNGAQGRIRSDQLWSDLTNILNSVGGGVSKTAEKWKKVWADWKSKTKKKALMLRRHASGTGDGPARQLRLSKTDERVLAIIGRLAVQGQASEELRCNRLPASENVEDQAPPPCSLNLEVIDDNNDQSPISSTHSSPESAYSWHQSSTSQEPPPDLSTLQGRAQVPPAAPAATPDAATPPRRRRWLALPLSTTPARGRARPRPPTPATPQSAGSPMRPRVHPRRRPTPFERAASQFAAVELRRLDLEDTRARQLHEREMRALEVEHERNQIFSSLVSVAQQFVEYLRSRDNIDPLKTE